MGGVVHIPSGAGKASTAFDLPRIAEIAIETDLAFAGLSI
jgi:hypothetical protein